MDSLTSSLVSTEFPIAMNNSVKVERKLFEQINKLSKKVLKYSRSENLKLVNSPPFIIEIIQEMCQHFNNIQSSYEKKMHILSDIEYFKIFTCNLIEKLNKIIELFKKSSKTIYDEDSEARAKFTKYTLNLSHMLAELKSLFPKDMFEGESFQIVKLDAAEFWRKNFNGKAIVSWNEFENKLDDEHKISSKTEAAKLRRTVQLTDSSHVSIFEFDIFTRLFQPWSNLLDNWKFLATEHPGYSAFTTYEDIKKRLQKYIHKPGSYLYRLSITKLGQWAIGYVTPDHKILQTITHSLIEALKEGQSKNTYLYPNGSEIVIDISAAIEATSAIRIQTSKEQNEQYLIIDSTFEICKICAENNKDRKLEPCGHMICSMCLKTWQDRNLITNTTCPFCRCEIKAFEPIIISPFEYPILTETLEKFQNNSSYSLSEIDHKDLDYLNISSQQISTLTKNDNSLNTILDENNSYEAIDTSRINPFENFASIEGNTTLSENSIPSVSNLIQFYETLCKKISAEVIMKENESNVSYLTPNTFFTTQKPQINCVNPKNNIEINGSTSPNRDKMYLSLSSRSSFLGKTTISAPSSSIFSMPVQNNLIVTQKDNCLEIKIENNNLLNDLALKFGYDRTKVACALVIANNDILAAHEILKRSVNS